MPQTFANALRSITFWNTSVQHIKSHGYINTYLLLGYALRGADSALIATDSYSTSFFWQIALQMTGESGPTSALYIRSDQSMTNPVSQQLLEVLKFVFDPYWNEDKTFQMFYKMELCWKHLFSDWETQIKPWVFHSVLESPPWSSSHCRLWSFTAFFSFNKITYFHQNNNKPFHWKYSNQFSLAWWMFLLSHFSARTIRFYIGNVAVPKPVKNYDWVSCFAVRKEGLVAP